MSVAGWVLGGLLVLVVAGGAAVWALLRSRNMHIWIFDYLRRRSPEKVAGPVHVMFCFVDHFEPMWKGADLATQRARVDRWCHDYRALAARHSDADGRPPQHTFFYPEEEYAEEHLDKLAALCADGYGEIEVHLHHDNDTEANFRQSITRFCRILHEHHGARPAPRATTGCASGSSMATGAWTTRVPMAAGAASTMNSCCCGNSVAMPISPSHRLPAKPRPAPSIQSTTPRTTLMHPSRTIEAFQCGSEEKPAATS